MRWFWLDRFTEFVSGSHATAVKCVSLSEDHLHDHWPGYPVMPNSLVAEGMAQCGGLLVSESTSSASWSCWPSSPSAAFEGEARPGDVIRYHANDRTSEGRRRVRHREGRHRRPAILGSRDFLRPLRRRLLRTAPAAACCSTRIDLLHWLRVVGVFDVGVRARRHAPPRRRLPSFANASNQLT